MRLLGLRTIIYPSDDLEADKKWWADVTGVVPYFDQPFYVGFEIGGYELGLDPNSKLDGPLTYWGVENVQEAFDEFIQNGCESVSGPSEVGDGIIVAAVKNPKDHPIGLIYNPHFKAKD